MVNRPPSTSFSGEYWSEPALRRAIVRRLRTFGLEVAENVRSDVGIADLVTRHQNQQTIAEMYEVKWRLERKALYQAIGQVLLNRQSLNPDASAIIIGYPHPEMGVLIPYISMLGIRVIPWQDVAKGDHELAMGETSPDSNIHALPPSALHWSVKECAEARGIASIRELSFATRASRQNLYSIYRGVAKSISLDMLATLARTLDADPGGWFYWEGGNLHWQVRVIAEAQGLDQRELGWRSHIVPHALASIWEGRQRSVFLETLAKLARALHLDVGNLFTWDETGR